MIFAVPRCKPVRHGQFRESRNMDTWYFSTLQENQLGFRRRTIPLETVKTLIPSRETTLPPEEMVTVEPFHLFLNTSKL